MAGICTGVDIGANEVKFAVCKDGKLLRCEAAPLPEDVIRDGLILSPEALGQFLRESVKTLKLRRSRCAVVLPAAVAFFRRSSLPPMSIENLKLNLPYEFRDYITDEREKYVFDYALLDMQKNENGTPVSMDIMAAAALRETIESYRSIMKYAGFTMRVAIPEEAAYSNLLRRYETAVPEDAPREYCILDLGHAATRLYFYRNAAHEATQLIDYGYHTLDEAIADTFSVDIHMAASYKTSDYQNALQSEACQNFYNRLSIDLMQSLNFYSYNNPESNLRDIYFCGGGAQIAPLRKAIGERLSLRTHSAAELMNAEEKDGAPPLSLFTAAYGATLQ